MRLNRNTIYFLQRVASAAATALVYALADKMAEKNRPSYKNRSNWKPTQQQSNFNKSIKRTPVEKSRSFRDQYQ